MRRNPGAIGFLMGYTPAIEIALALALSQLKTLALSKGRRQAGGHKTLNERMFMFVPR
jgi:hypothetical protein